MGFQGRQVIGWLEWLAQNRARLKEGREQAEEEGSCEDL